MSGFSTARQKMVDGQVRASDVTDLRIIDAMSSIPREAFVPASQQGMAYLDLDLDVGEGRFLIKPAVLAKMLQAAEIVATDHVLVVGSGTGYSAALVAKLAGQVTATESDAGSTSQVSSALQQQGITGVKVQQAAAADGDPANAPYDVIVLDGATGIVPEKLYGQLRDGGRLVGVFAAARPARAMIVARAHGDFGTRALFDAVAPVLPGLARTPSFIF